MLDSVKQDLRYAVRQLRAAPVFTASAIACLAIGVWLACVVTAVGREAWRPDLGFRDPDRIVQISAPGIFRPDREGLGNTMSVADVEELRRSHAFAGVGDYRGSGVQLDGERGGRPVALLSSDMFATLGKHRTERRRRVTKHREALATCTSPSSERRLTFAANGGTIALGAQNTASLP